MINLMPDIRCIISKFFSPLLYLGRDWVLIKPMRTSLLLQFVGIWSLEWVLSSFESYFLEFAHNLILLLDCRKRIHFCLVHLGPFSLWLLIMNLYGRSGKTG